MKRTSYFLILAVMAIGLVVKVSARTKVSGSFYRSPALCTSATPVFDVADVDRISVVATYSSGTYSAVSFDDNSVSSSLDAISKANTFGLGQGVYLSTSTNVVFPGLTWGTTYFVIPVTSSLFKLATTSANAVLGTAIDISTSSTMGGSYTLTPSTYTAGSAGFQWQFSNDNTNFISFPLASVSSVTISGVGTTSVGWDFANFNYRYLRMNFTGPTRGCVNIDASMNGRDYN